MAWRNKSSVSKKTSKLGLSFKSKAKERINR